MDRGWLKAVPVVIAIAVVGVGAALGFNKTEPPVVPDQVVVAAGTPAAATVSGGWAVATTVPPTPTSYPVADAIGATVQLYESPGGPPHPAKQQLQNPTHEGLAVVFAVLEDKGEWLHVRVSSRPNQMTAWVKKSEVALRSVPNRVLVEVGARKVTVFHGDEPIMQATVAIGTDRTPTPLGKFFVDGIVDVAYDTGPYGAYQVSVAGFSDVLQSFGGGVGQIALHGTNAPGLLGQAVSNGCVRMSNDDITKMAQLAPTGTPVEIVA